MRNKEQQRKYFAWWYSKPDNKARKNLQSRLWAKAHPELYRRKLTDSFRFNKFTDFKGDTECWNWLGWKGPNGYGRVSYKGKVLYAHRFSFLINCGDIIDGKQVLHTCDNPACVNPKHLWLGTIKENMQDRDRKKRDRFSRTTNVV